MKYSETFKDKMVQKLADPRGPSASQLASDVGVPQTTLSRWLRDTGKIHGEKLVFSSSPSTNGVNDKRPQDRSAEERLQVVIEAASLSDDELGAFLRSRGLHETHLLQWRGMMLSGLNTRSARASKRCPQARRLRELEEELRRKDKALAETAALLVLQKKVRSLWGDEGGNTTRSNAK